MLLLLPHLSLLSPSTCGRLGRFAPAWHSVGMTVLRPDEAAARLLQQPNYVNNGARTSHRSGAA